MHPLISICVASNKPELTLAQLQNISQTISNPNKIEYLIKIDDEDETMRCAISAAVSKFDFPIRIYSSPREGGYFTLHHGYNALSEMAKGYFIQLLNDGIRYETKDWDKMLEKYVGHFEDDLFCVRVSQYRRKKHRSLNEALHNPENYGFYTRKWISTVGGWASGTFWGADSWQEGIHYTLKKKYSLNRGIVIDSIQLSGEDFGEGLSFRKKRARAFRSYRAYDRLLRRSGRENFIRLASRIEGEIFRYHRNLSERLEEDSYTKTIKIGSSWMRSYRIPHSVEHLKIYFLNNVTTRIFNPKRIIQTAIDLIYLLPLDLNLGIKGAISKVLGWIFRLPPPSQVAGR